MTQPVPEWRDRDAAWILRIRNDDSAAFEALFLAYHEPLLRFAHGYLKTRSATEEVVQDVFSNIWEKRVQWEVRDNVRTYLYAATRNGALNRIRRGELERRWAAAVVEAIDAPTVFPRVAHADERVELAELDDAIRRAIDCLPPRCRETFVLSRQHHLSYEQIGVTMGLSVKTVQEQMSRALRALRVSLADWLK
jgi:RNA polymerase sigma-70 factor (ECF subfamily)